MDILGLTSTEAVRAVLGVDTDAGELDEQVFEDVAIEDMVTLELSTWLPTSLAEAKAVTGPAKLALNACALYHAALIMLPSLRHAAPSKLGDGQNEVVRQPRDFDALQTELSRKLQTYQQILTTALTPTTPTAVTFFGSAAPVFDPVTG